MKTAVSIPDEIFEEAERLAGRLKTSRSELYRRALEEYVSRHAPDPVTAALDATCANVGEGAPDELTHVASRRTLERSEW